MSNLYERVNYLADISYIFNTYITEYDISKANINVLYSKNIIDKNTYDRLYNSKRMVRQVFIGKLQKENPEAVRVLKQGIIEAKRDLFINNAIQDYDVLSIKNDAVYIINKNLKYTKFGLIEFIPKNVYTSYLRINTAFCKLELYYYYSNISKIEYLDIKGIKDENILIHKNYFYDILKDILFAVQTESPEIALNMMKDIYNNYVSLNLPIGYYREFNNRSDYRFLNASNNYYGRYGINNTNNERFKPLLDIRFNLLILIEIQKILLTNYFNKR